MSENDASSEGEVNSTKAANRAQSDGESNSCDSTEGNSLKVAEAKEQTAVKHDYRSFSSLRTILDPYHFRHDAYQDEEDVSSTWPSQSLPKFNTRYMDNQEPLPYLVEPVENVTKGQTSDIPPESDHGSSINPSLVSQCGDDYCGSDSGSQYPLTEYSQSLVGVVQLLLTLHWILKAQEKRALIRVPPMTEPRVRTYNLSRTPDLAPPVTTNYSTRRSMSSLLKKKRNWKINTWHWIQTFIITTNC